MATRQLYVGSVGPLLYDDADVYDGTAEPHRGVWIPKGRIRSSTMTVDTAPVASGDVVRIDDLLGGGGVLNPVIVDRTASRSIDSVYQNTTPYWMIVAVTVDLED